MPFSNVSVPTSSSNCLGASVVADRAVDPCPVLLVTADAVTHAEIADLSDSRLANRPDIAVTCRAIEAVTNVHGVDEVTMIWELMDPRPQNRLLLLEGCHELLEFRPTLRWNDLVTLHTELDRR